MSSDVLSQVLRAVRLTGAVFYSVDAGTPWVAEAPHSRELAPIVLPGSEHVIEYHLITRGTCWGGVAGDEQIQLSVGDLIIFPQGDAHVLSSEPGMRVAEMRSPPTRPLGTQLPVVFKDGGAGESNVELVCGFLGCDARPFNPLLDNLPRVLHIKAAQKPAWLDSLLRLAVEESRAGKAGGECVLERVSELLFVEVVRSHLDSLPAEQTGWLAGLRDSMVGRALSRLHERPAYPWTIDALAKEVGASRSALADRFTEFVGLPPMQYLGRWRMQLAASRISSGEASVASIGAEVGYESEAAFSRAFKKIVGVSPASWRRAQREGRASV